MATPTLDEAAIFNAARHILVAEPRAEFLREACGDDLGMRARVEALLRVHERELTFLESPALKARTLPATVVSEGPGSLVGPYKLLERIGEGGFGVVFTAEQQQPIRRTVALKILKPGMDTRQVIARFEAERQALALMDHPNIARVLDGGETASGRPFFVMELIKGVPITTYCDQQRLTPRERLGLFATVCQAVQHAHQKGIIHRDLKPTNVLIAAYDGKPVPKLIDFGIAKALTQRLTDLTLVTGFGNIVGTLDYMSPEQAEFNAMDVDTRADIYSLGVLLYELLTGTTPLTHERLQKAAMEEALRLIREEDPPKPSSRLSETKEALASISAQRKLEPARLTKEIRGDLDWIVMHALEKNRNRRYATSGNFADDIERYLHGEAILARPPSALYRLRMLARRRRAAVLTVSAVAGAILLGAVVAAWQAVEALEAVEAEKEAKATALAKEAESRAVLDFVQNRIFAAARPEGKEGGLGPEVSLRHALQAALPAVQKSFAGQPLLEARLHMTLGVSFLLLSEPGIAAEEFGRARTIYLAKLGPEDATTLESTNNLATAYADLGRDAEALKLREETLALRRATLGPDHVDTLGSMKNLANSYVAANRLEEAVKLDEETVALLKTKLGPNDPDTLASMNNLATGYSDQHRFVEALALNGEVFERLKAVRGPTHPDTLVSMGNLAKSYSDLGRDEQARKLKEEVLALQKAKSGDHHADTIQTMHSLATTDVKLGRYQEALALHQEALRLRREKFGPDNYQTLLSMWGVAFALDKLQRTDDALPIIDECLKRAAGKKFRSDFFGLADVRLRYFEKKKDVAGCRTTAELFESIPPTTALGFYNASCMRAVTAALILSSDKSPVGEKHSREEGDRAMVWLQKAIDAGFKDIASLKKDSDLMPLHGRPDFEMLIAKLDAGMKK
jgi:eukaryotic-like serine/threonine-protein kinase